MFITGINKLFHKHGRIAFGLLTIVIIIPFVLYFSAAPQDLLEMFQFGGRSSNVTMYGSAVSQKKLNSYKMSAMISMLLRGYQVNFETMMDQPQVLQEALKRIRLMRVADQQGIKVDDMQVAFYIRNLPIFQTKGQFNIKMYDIYMQYFLAKYGLNIKDFENTARENLVMKVLQSQIADSVVVTDGAARAFYNTIHSKYNVKVATFDSSDYVRSVKVNEKAMRQYFDSNRNKYLIPAKCKADVVRFNFIACEKEAAKKVTTKQVDLNYKQNKTIYKKMTETAAKAKIKKELINKECNKLAKRKAQQFAVDVFKLIEKSGGKNAVSIFSRFASKNKFTVHKINDWIDANTKVIPRLGRVPEVVKAVTNLYLDQPITNAVLGKNAYFVACLTAKQPARKAKFSEVKDKVKTDFVKEKSLELARAAAKDAAVKAVASLKKEKELPSSIDFKSFPTFSQANPMSIFKEKNGYNVMMATRKTKEGAVSQATNTSTGAILVYVQEITLPSNKDFEKQREANLKTYREVLQQATWVNYLATLKQESNTMVKASPQDDRNQPPK